MKKLYAVIVLWLMAVSLAFANGENNGPQFGGTSTSSATSGPAVGVGVGVGVGGAGGVGVGGAGGNGSGSASASASVGKALAIGLGSTGLTSTAPMLGSESVLFNLYSHTYVVPGAVHRYYAFVLCTRAKDENACFFKMACMDPDLAEDVKSYIDCKPAQPTAATDNPGKTALFTQGQ